MSNMRSLQNELWQLWHDGYPAAAELIPCMQGGIGRHHASRSVLACSTAVGRPARLAPGRQVSTEALPLLAASAGR